MELPIHYNSAEWQDRRRAREEYVKRQNGRCWYCQCALDKYPPPAVSSRTINWRLFPKNFLKHPIHLHHSHDTGMSIGAVHAYCNAVLWQYEGQ